MKHTFILMCCLLGATLLYAQSVFTGRVYDAKTNTGLVGANVYIEDLKLTATTDSMGYFEFLELPAGSYTVSAKMVGYAMKQGIYSLKGTVNQDIKMEAYDYEIDEVVVTGQMRATAITQTPQAITEVSSDYLAHNASTNIVDAIAKVPGLSAITNGKV